MAHSCATLDSDHVGSVNRDIFAIQDQISRGIVNSLRLKLGRGRRRYQTSPEAYDLYSLPEPRGSGIAGLC